MPPADPRDLPLADPGLDRVLTRLSPTGRCPEAEVLAGFAERRLLAGESAEVQRHLAACVACASAVAALVRDGAATIAPQRRQEGGFSILFGGRAWRVPPLAAAAALLLAVGLAIAAPFLLGGSRGADQDTEAILVASARDLARSRPDLFAGFRPLDRSERTASGLERRRGEFPAVYPAEKILEDRPEFRWEPPPGAASFRVVLLGPDGREIWSAETEGRILAYGGVQLPPGRYLWEVTASGALEPETARRAFEVVGPDERRAVEEAMGAVDASVAEPARLLLKAHYALRRDLLGEALRWSDEFAARSPGDPVGEETSRHVRARLGSSPE